MSSIPIYNQNGQVCIDQSIPTGESSNKIANAKFVVDTVNAVVNTVNAGVNTVNDKVDTLKFHTDASFTLMYTIGQLTAQMNDEHYAEFGVHKTFTDASFVKLGNGQLTVGSATNISAGNTGDLLYQGGANTTSKLAIGSNGTVLLSNGTQPVWTAQSGLTVGSATTSTNISSGTAGDLLYQSGANTTSKLAIGSNNTVLLSSGTVPVWTAQSGLTVGSATTSTTSTNISGGSAGNLLYQSASNITAKLSNGTIGQLLISNGSSAPTWVSGYYDVSKSYVDISINSLRTDVDTRFTTLIDGTLPQNLDTLKEIVDYIKDSSTNIVKTMISVDASFNGLKNGNLIVEKANKLATARTIGGVSFDGTANINLPGVNSPGNQDTSGNAAAAYKFVTARNIGGVSFDGTANINLPGVNAPGNQDTSGNAAAAYKFVTARTIGGVSFNGTANIDLSGVNIPGNQNTSGNAATATQLATARKINSVPFDGSADISLNVLGNTGGSVGFFGLAGSSLNSVPAPSVLTSSTTNSSAYTKGEFDKVVTDLSNVRYTLDSLITSLKNYNLIQ